jgi:hypothetical protein
VAFPLTDRLLVALQGAPDGPLATPAQLLQDSIHVIGMEAHAALTANQLLHARGRPQRRVVAQGLGTLLQSGFQGS